MQKSRLTRTGVGWGEGGFVQGQRTAKEPELSPQPHTALHETSGQGCRPPMNPSVQRGQKAEGRPFRWDCTGWARGPPPVDGLPLTTGCEGKEVKGTRGHHDSFLKDFSFFVED